MVTVVLGELTDYNKHRIEDIEKKYHKNLIIYKNTRNNFKIWFKNIKRPIIGDRLLVFISDISLAKRTDFYSFLQILEEIKDHSYADVLWHISELKSNLSDTITTVNLIILKQTYKSDFLLYMEKRYGNTEICLYILNKIAYNYKTYKLYQKEIEIIFKTKPKVEQRDIDLILTSKSLPPLLGVLFNIVKRNRNGRYDYLQYVERYGNQWVNGFFIDSLEDVIKLKLKYYKESKIKISTILESDKFNKYYNLMVNTNIGEIYFLLTYLRTTPYPIETYYSYDIKLSFDNKNDIEQLKYL